MKKLIAGICVTMLLASCGNDAEKKASEKLSAARSAFAQGDYNEAKLQIDSIKILYPKAFNARREGIKLMQQVELKEQQQTLVYLDSMMQTKQQELEKELYDYLKPYYVCGLDAVIVQDYGVLRCVRRWFPDLPVHCSTQMTITGPLGAKLLEEQGVTRIVTARELSLQEINKIHQATNLEIESFVHGALCYCYSGQCLFSSMIGGRSGNRGRCAQPCRLPYQTALCCGENGRRSEKRKAQELCPLSLKDISTIEILPQILEAGVTSLKIEGRMKQPGYTAGVTSVYRLSLIHI